MICMIEEITTVEVKKFIKTADFLMVEKYQSYSSLYNNKKLYLNKFFIK